jgi:hypothetical protein
MTTLLPELTEFADVMDGETVLRLVAVGDGRVMISVARHGYAPVPGVAVEPVWVGPLSCWFAGADVRCDIGPDGQPPVARYFLRMISDGCRTVDVLGLRSRAQIVRDRPDGPVHVTTVRGGGRLADGFTVCLSPGQRRQVADWLSCQVAV